MNNEEDNESCVTPEIRRKIVSEYLSKIARRRNPRKGFGSNRELAKKAGSAKVATKGFGSDRARAAAAGRASAMKRWHKEELPES